MKNISLSTTSFQTWVSKVYRMWIKILLIISIKYCVAVPFIYDDEEREVLESIENSYDKTILALQKIYYDDDSVACTSKSRVISKTLEELLKREWCFQIERTIYYAFRKLHNSFDAFTHDEKSKIDSKSFLKQFKKVNQIMIAMNENKDVNQRKIELIIFFGTANDWHMKMQRYLVNKFKSTSIC